MAGWWHDAVGYEIYVRSFADADGDGVGDLAGIRSRLDHLVELGVDVIWLTPFYPSPQADYGYDVTDHLDVDPTFGSLEQLLELIDDAHSRGLRVLIDVVPNHTSDHHPWFVDSRASIDSPRRDWYVWRDPAPDGSPPNNWVSYFGGPAWTLDEATGQYYMHLFLPEQPDLNWANPDVRAAFERIIETWLARGADGVRIDVAQGLVEDPDFRDNPFDPDRLAVARTPQEVFDAFTHVRDLDQDGVLDVYRAWRRIADRHDALLLGEVYLFDARRVARYVGAGGLHAAFCFPALRVGWDADQIRTTLRAHLDLAGSSLAWPLSSHDDPRAVTRFGGGPRGRDRALAYLTLLCGLPGMPWLFQGDELGLEDADLSTEVLADPLAVRNPGASGRDSVRAPMPWKPGPGMGFTTGTPWLPHGRNRTAADTRAAQRGDPGAPLERTRALLAARRALPVLRADTPAHWLADDGPVIAVDRGGEVIVALNAGARTHALAVGEAARLAYASADGPRISDGVLRLPPDTAVYVTRR